MVYDLTDSTDEELTENVGDPTHELSYEELREKYERAAQIRQENLNTLEAAKAKQLHLQAECNLLIDSIAENEGSDPHVHVAMERLQMQSTAPSPTVGTPHPYRPPQPPSPLPMVVGPSTHYPPGHASNSRVAPQYHSPPRSHAQPPYMSVMPSQLNPRATPPTHTLNPFFAYTPKPLEDQSESEERKPKILRSPPSPAVVKSPTKRGRKKKKPNPYPEVLMSLDPVPSPPAVSPRSTTLAQPTAGPSHQAVVPPPRGPARPQSSRPYPPLPGPSNPS